MVSMPPGENRLRRVRFELPASLLSDFGFEKLSIPRDIQIRSLPQLTAHSAPRTKRTGCPRLFQCQERCSIVGLIMSRIPRIIWARPN